eukprot:m.23316 g.23316  ORF g.23316 m.23316 type:complete len:372 (-) comp8483_c1_seq1:436-1551(-)
MDATNDVRGPLPKGWSQRIDPETNQTYFIHHITKTTTWVDPRDMDCKPRTFDECRGGELPLGWEFGYDPDVGVYYIDHNTWTTTLQDPRPKHVPATSQRLPISSRTPPQRMISQGPMRAHSRSQPRHWPRHRPQTFSRSTATTAYTKATADPFADDTSAAIPQRERPSSGLSMTLRAKTDWDYQMERELQELRRKRYELDALQTQLARDKQHQQDRARAKYEQEYRDQRTKQDQDAFMRELVRQRQLEEQELARTNAELSQWMQQSASLSQQQQALLAQILADRDFVSKDEHALSKTQLWEELEATTDVFMPKSRVLALHNQLAGELAALKDGLKEKQPPSGRSKWDDDLQTFVDTESRLSPQLRAQPSKH